MYFSYIFSKYSNTCTEQTSNCMNLQSLCITRALHKASSSMQTFENKKVRIRTKKIILISIVTRRTEERKWTSQTRNLIRVYNKRFEFHFQSISHASVCWVDRIFCHENKSAMRNLPFFLWLLYYVQKHGEF